MNAPAATDAGRTGWPPRLAAAVGLSVALLAGIVAVTDVFAGFGRDLHVLRVAATGGVLLVAALMLLWPGQTWGGRAQAVAIALIFGPMAWWRVPCRSDGPYLFQAGVQRDAMLKWLELLPPEDAKPLPRIRETLESLAADYPALCAGARAAVDRRIAEVVEGRVKELRDLPAPDAAGFTKTAPARREVVNVFPEAKPQLAAAEAEWATRWARDTAALYTQTDLSPADIRLGCREGEEQLLGLPALDDAPGRLLEARREFFLAAHETTEKEIAALHKKGQFDRAFTTALNHKREWAQLFGLLTRDERQSVDGLLARCEALKSKGDATLVETAPVPRSKDGGNSP